MSEDYLEIKFMPGLRLTFENEHRGVLPFSNSSLYQTTILDAEYLTRGDDVKSVLKLRLSRENINYEYEPGNTIGIIPKNDETEVNLLIERLGLEAFADVPCVLSVLPNVKKKNASVPNHLPQNGTIRQIFTENINLRCPPKKLFLRKLGTYSSDEDREKLKLLSSPDSSADYNKLVAQQGKVLLNLLNSIPSCRPPVERLLEALPALLPRPYSIASSPLEEDAFEVIFSLVEHDDGTKGVCTSYLEKLASSVIEHSGEKPKVKFYFRKATNFLLPQNPKSPILMIGPGTGVAPFIGFLKHRLLQQVFDNLNFGPMWLFYGCRYSERDYLYKKEIERFLRDGLLSKLFLSFSREGDRTYVQDKIRGSAPDLADMILNHNAVIFVCGDKKNMISEVRNEIEACLSERGHLNRVNVLDYLSQIIKDNRFVTDAWL